MRTRSTLSGAKSAVMSSSTSASRRTCAACFSLDAPQRARHDRCDRKSEQLEGQHARVDARELEEVVDEDGEDTHLLAQHRHVLLGSRETVLERLEHRLHVGEGRPQIVARPRHELAPGVEEAPQVIADLVEGGGELGNLCRPSSGTRTSRIAARELDGRIANRLDRADDRACQRRAPRRLRSAPTRP